MKVCEAPGCSAPINAKSLCRPHYDRMRRRGTFEPWTPPPLPETKQCPECGEVKDRIEGFYKSTTERRHTYCKKCFGLRARKTALKAKYGITLEEYDTILKSQNFACAICGLSQDDSYDVDHCHETGKVRGLLCRTCNRGIGLLKDDPKILARALEYINEG